MTSTENFGLANFGQAQTSGYEGNSQISAVHSRHSQSAEYEREQASLPKADGGKDAWWFLAGCFLIEALTWGKQDFWILLSRKRVQYSAGTCQSIVTSCVQWTVASTTFLAMPHG